jgi:phosphatidylglycerophosphatase A
MQFPHSLQLTALTIAFLSTCAASLALGPWAQRYWRTQDPRNFVLDEVAGYLLVVMFFHDAPMWQTIGWAFFLFRVFDVIKISPAREIDRNWHGTWGILLDDLVSAGYAAATIGLLRWLGWLSL